jgi:predicted dehydrogenase
VSTTTAREEQRIVDQDPKQLYSEGESRDGSRGTGQSHPSMADWWKAGCVIGWQSTCVRQWRAFLGSALAAESDPLQATLHDGVRANELGDAMLRSAREGRRLTLAPEPAGVRL